MMTSLETVCPADLNDDKHTIVGFEYKKMFPDFVSLCRGLGSTELVPRSQEDLKMIIDSFEDFSGNCNNKFWVPVRQRRGRQGNKMNVFFFQFLLQDGCRKKKGRLIIFLGTQVNPMEEDTSTAQRPRLIPVKTQERLIKKNSHAQCFATRILISFSKHTNIIPAEIYLM